MNEATKPPSHELVSAIADDVLEVASRAERGDARLKRLRSKPFKRDVRRNQK